MPKTFYLFAVIVLHAVLLHASDLSLPIELVGPDDLLSITVVDCPELTRSFRISKDGNLTLPLLPDSLKVAGLSPIGISDLLTTELIRQQILVRPVVSVQVLEYRSRFITVAGAVKHPGRQQISGRTTLLDAIAGSDGILPEAGPYVVFVSDAHTRIIPIDKLMAATDSSSNPVLSGGEEVRVPEAKKVYVTGNVKHPGAYSVHDGESTSVLKILAQCEGQLPFSSSTAYIYRLTGDGQQRTELPVPLGKLLARKSPDVLLYGSDIFYIPDHQGKRLAATILNRVSQFGAYTSSQALVIGR
jgi:polysaccharide biosynthesis/export protein